MGKKSWFRRAWLFMQRENLHRLLFLLVIVVAFSTVGITFLEPKMTVLNALWWSIVTLTTVGYGDISPATVGGRIVAVIIMFLGIGLLGMLSATIASVLVDKKLKEDRGMSSYNLQGHIIVCEWNHRARVILNEFRADPQTAEAPIVLIADIEHKPVNDENLFFIQGDVSDETLARASLIKANTVVILGDDRLDATTRDAKVVLNALTVESINPDAYTIVELVDEAHVRHCKRANADEIIVGSELSSGLIARAALDHGITQVVSDLLSSRDGNEFYKVPMPPSLIGRRFIEAMAEMKQKYQSIVVAVQKENTGEIITNPSIDYQFESSDHLIVIAPDRPQL
jgi:voltage-gated potassium channel